MQRSTCHSICLLHDNIQCMSFNLNKYFIMKSLLCDIYFHNSTWWTIIFFIHKVALKDKTFNSWWEKLIICDVSGVVLKEFSSMQIWQVQFSIFFHSKWFEIIFFINKYEWISNHSFKATSITILVYSINIDISKCYYM